MIRMELEKIWNMIFSYSLDMIEICFLKINLHL